MDDVAREPFPREVARSLRARSSSLDDSPSALVLALDCGQGVVGEILCDASCTEVVPDERVARPSIGENGGATLGEASVVDEPCPHESLERFRAYLRRDTALRELAVDLRGAPVTMAQ